MPGWLLHTSVAEKIADDMDVKHKEDFVIGSVVPDIPWLSVSDAIQSGKRSKLHCHVRTDNNIVDVPDISRWMAIYREQTKNSDLCKGMLTHIVLDHEINVLWNSIVTVIGFDSFVIKREGTAAVCDIKQAAQIKWTDEGCYSRAKFRMPETVRLWKDNQPINNILTSDAVDILISDFGVKTEELSGVVPAIKERIKNELSSDIKCDAVIPWETYDDLIDLVIRKYKYIITSLCR